MMGTENHAGISHIVSNTDAVSQPDLTPCNEKESVSGKKGVKGEHSYKLSPIAKKTRRRRPRKRGRKQASWWLRPKYQREHCPYRLRRCEVENLLAADRFAARTERRLCTFITIRWHFTNKGEANIQKRWSSLLNAFRIWASRRGVELGHVWVHENPKRDEPAFHTHVLANIPGNLRDEFRKWLVKQLGDLGGAIDVQPRTAIDWNKPDDRISYLCKGTDYATAMKYKLIRKHGWDYMQGIVEFRRSGTSRNINANSRAADAARSHESIKDLAA